MLWSMLVNVGLFVGLSLTGRREPAEHVQASAFVDAFAVGGGADARFWRGSATVGELRVLLARFLGDDGTRAALASYAARPAPTSHPTPRRSPSSSSTSSRCSPARWVPRPRGSSSPPWWRRNRWRRRGVGDPRRDLPGARLQPGPGAQVAAAEAATAELRQANERLQELDRLKDDFVSTVTHELRTPLTSIRAFSEILSDNPDLDPAERESTCGSWSGDRAADPADQPGARPFQARVRWRAVADRAGRPRRGRHHVGTGDRADLPGAGGRPRGGHAGLRTVVEADRDRLVQVLLNLLSNAVKFCPRETGRVQIGIESTGRHGTGRRPRQRTRHSRRGPRGHLREVPSGR